MTPSAFRSLPGLALVLLITAGILPASGQDSFRFDLLDESRFWIQGTTSVNRFSCHVDTVTGSGEVPVAPSPRALERSEDHLPQDTARVAVPVQHFDCGNARMSSDLQETLGADSHPHIRFRLERLVSVDPAPPSADREGEWYRLEVLGHLTVSGTERLVRVTAWGQPLQARLYRVTGCKQIRMTYFGIDPPTKFMSLVKVHDRIQVHFDLLVEAPPGPSRGLATPSLSNPPECHDDKG